jgi:hypothetical protein
VYITFPATGARSISGVTVDPSSITLNQGGTQTFTATVTGDAGNPPTPQNVTWTVTGNSSAGTTITPNGLLTVAINEENPSLTIRATSVADTTQYGEVTVAVNVVVYTLISDQADLQNIASDMTGKYKLNADITLTNWTPLGTNSTPFTGVFDGNGKTITVQSFDSAALSAAYLSIFGYVKGTSAASRAELKNLNIVSALPGITLTGSGTKRVGLLAGYTTNVEISGITLTGTTFTLESGQFNAGGIVGEAASNSKIVDCHNNTDVTITLTGSGASYCGGIVGNVGSAVEIENCSFIGDISVTSSGSGIPKVGGIVGENRGLITDCWVEGSVLVEGPSKTYAGGIAGECFNGSISQSYFDGTLTITRTSSGNNDEFYAGGITAYASGSGRIEDCWSGGTITGIDNAGGIAGMLMSGSTVSLSRCYSTAGIIRTGITTNSTNTRYGAGGIVASQRITSANTLTDCVALNPSITGGATADIMHRVFGRRDNPNGASNTANNHGWTGMTITPASGTYTAAVGAEESDGADLADQKPLQAFYTDTLGWDFTPGTGVWKMDGGDDYPKLQWQN